MSNNKINIIIIQKKIKNNVNLSIQDFLKTISNISIKGNTVIVLQELSYLKYIGLNKSKKNKSLAIKITSRIIKDFCDICKQKKIFLFLPIFESCKNKYYNSCVAISNKGKVLGVYRKKNIPHEKCYYEKFYFSSSQNNFKVFDIGVCKIGVMICWDQWYANSYSTLAKNGADLIVCPTSIGWAYYNNKMISLKDEKKKWKMVIQSNSLMNNIPIIVSNRTGIEKSSNHKISFWGSSFITDSHGNIIAQAKNKTQFLKITLNLKEKHKAQKYWNFIT